MHLCGGFLSHAIWVQLAGSRRTLADACRLPTVAIDTEATDSLTSCQSLTRCTRVLAVHPVTVEGTRDKLTPTRRRGIAITRLAIPYDASRSRHRSAFRNTPSSPCNIVMRSRYSSSLISAVLSSICTLTCAFVSIAPKYTLLA